MTPRDEAVLVIVQELVRRRWLQAEDIDALAQCSRLLRTSADALRFRRRVVRQHGFPHNTRTSFWLQIAHVPRLKKELAAPHAFAFTNLIGIESIDDTATLESTGIEGEIARDVVRTFPMMPFFSDEGDGQRQLQNVLKGVAVFAPDIEYCQGMNYVAAMLLQILNDPEREATLPDAMSAQEAAFWIMIAFIRHRGMAELWKSKMPGLSRCIYLYNQLLQIHFYDLYAHLRNIGMHPSFLATQWFVTVFARVMALPMLERVWDLFLLDGWKVVYRLALAITAHLRPYILPLDMEECSEFFRHHPKLKLEHLGIDELITSALSFKVTRKMLTKMEQERHLEYLRLRLQKAPLSADHSMLFPSLGDGAIGQEESLAFIRAQLQDLDADVASDTVVLRRKIEAADKMIAQTTESLYGATYALKEAAFDLEEHMEIKQRLRLQFQELTAVAISEATAPVSPSAAAATRAAAGTRVTTIWNPIATLGYLNSRMYECFERAARLPVMLVRETPSSSRRTMYSDDEDEDDDDLDEQQDSDARRNLASLAILVPRLAADLHAIQRKSSENRKLLRQVQRRYVRLQQQCQLAQVTFDELQLFKDRLSDQLLQLMLETERRKNARMQQLFAEVDEITELRG